MIINTQALLKDLDEYVTEQLECVLLLKQRAASYKNFGNYISANAFLAAATNLEENIIKLQNILSEYKD